MPQETLDYNTLSPLQQAAVERIKQFQQELEGYGLKVRAAIELEFVAQNEHSQPIEHSINLVEANRYLKAHLPFIEKIDDEAPGHNLNPCNKAHYEVNISGYAPFPEPLQIAAVTHQLKKHTLREMLQETTCLTPVAEHFQMAPNFSAMPYPKSKSPLEAKITSGMHINISLYNARGDNLFADERIPLWQHCADSILKMQDQIGLALLPNENSLLRVSLGAERESSVPSAIGLSTNKARRCGDSQFSDATSLLIRDRYACSNRQRLENRLPSADADPFVAMAVTLAGIVHAVRTQVIPIGSDHVTTQRLSPDSKYKVQIRPVYDFETYELPATLGEATRTLRESRLAKELLGDKLHKAILQEFGRNESPHTSFRIRWNQLPALP